MVLFSLLAGTFFITGCSEDKATTGSLSVVVMDQTGGYVPYINVNIAKTLSDLQNHVYIKTVMSTDKGVVVFHDLLPDYYWISAENWKDYGSVRIYSGIDQYMVLWLNNQGGKN